MSQKPSIAAAAAFALLAVALPALHPARSAADERPACQALSGVPFGVCHAFCEAQLCEGQQPSFCDALRRGLEEILGRPGFPCECHCDGAPGGGNSSGPGEGSACHELTGAALGLCTAFCDTQDCPERPQPSCEVLRQTFEALTGHAGFPCEYSCGNAIVDPGEQCDDGNMVDGDCCSADCHLEPSTALCRPAAGICDLPEFCTGTSPTCPTDLTLDCDDRNPCTADHCHPASGCTHAPVPGCCASDANCLDQDACNGGETCVDHSCHSGAPPACDDLNPCTDDACDPAHGCVHSLNTAPCDDGDICTRHDACQAGACVGSDRVVCSALDDCHEAGSCDPQSGLCSTPARPDGATCDDRNPCTQTDRCEAGSCVGSSPVVCTSPDQCHDPGICDWRTGACSTPPRPDGTGCDDADPCTEDACQAGVCTGTALPSGPDPLSIACRLDALAASMPGGAPSSSAGPSALSRVARRGAPDLDSAPARAAFRRQLKALRALLAVIKRRARSHTVPAQLRAPALHQVERIGSDLQALSRSLRPRAHASR